MENINFDHLIFILSALVLVSIIIARLSNNLGVPFLVLFILIGMAAGSEGPVGIDFDNYPLTKLISYVCLAIILFSGGIDTNWKSVKKVILPASLLATAGVFITALAVGLFVHYYLGFSFMESFLLGAIVSSTDSAAVFSVLRAKHLKIKGESGSLIELESGSNDPMAIFLTMGIIAFIAVPDTGAGDILLLFVMQMGIGAVAGFLSGHLLIYGMNKFNFGNSGFYPVLTLTIIFLTFSLTNTLGGSGFLAVYIAGLVAGNYAFVHKKSTMRFLDGLAWLSQITLFLTLGLLVFPSKLLGVIVPGVIISLVLMFIGRPLGVVLSLLGSKFNLREQLFISWGGLKGAVPIVLATIPFTYGIPLSESIFNLVFFIVFMSALLQGWSLPAVARLLKLDEKSASQIKSPLEMDDSPGLNNGLFDFFVADNSISAGKSLMDLELPEGSLVVLIQRGDNYVVPSGKSVLQAGDLVIVLGNKHRTAEISRLFSALS